MHIVNIRHYEKVNNGFLLKETIGAPYAMAARSCIGEVQSWREQYFPEAQPVTIVFEDHAQDKGSLEWVVVRDKLSALSRNL